MKFNISMQNELYAKLKEKAKNKNVSVSEYIRFSLTILWHMEGEKYDKE